MARKSPCFHRFLSPRSGLRSLCASLFFFRLFSPFLSFLPIFLFPPSRKLPPVPTRVPFEPELWIRREVSALPILRRTYGYRVLIRRSRTRLRRSRDVISGLLSLSSSNSRKKEKVTPISKIYARLYISKIFTRKERGEKIQLRN